MPPRIVLDSNIFVSALVFGGNSSRCLKLVSKRKIVGVISPAIMAETFEILAKKFNYSPFRLEELQNQIQEYFELVHPSITISISRDPDDNRVLEAGVEGDCGYIVTGDKDLLDLKKYKDIIILTPSDFLLDNPRSHKQ